MDAVQSPVQAVAVAQVDRGDTQPVAAFVAGVVPLVLGVPELAYLRGDGGAESGFQDAVNELGGNDPVVADRLGESVDRRGAEFQRRPSSPGPGSARFRSPWTCRGG